MRVPLFVLAVVSMGCSGRSDSSDAGQASDDSNGGSDSGSASTSATTTEPGGTGSTGNTTGSAATGSDAGDASEGYAEQWCAIVLACDCAEPAHGSIEECTEAKQAEIDGARSDAEAVGATWDQDCADLKLAWYEAACDGKPGHDHCEGGQCALFSGAAAEGDTCAAGDGMVSVCAVGLGCHEARCSSYCSELSRGENCQGIPLGAHCADGLTCALQDLGAWCEEPRGVGSGCMSNGPYCPSPLICDVDAIGTQNPGTCVEPPPRGDPCIDGQCAPDDYCDMGTCRAKQGEGAPCTGHSACVSFACDGGFCLAPAELGDDCSLANCVEPLWCDSMTKRCIELEPYLCQVVGG